MQPDIVVGNVAMCETMLNAAGVQKDRKKQKEQRIMYVYYLFFNSLRVANFERIQHNSFRLSKYFYYKSKSNYLSTILTQH